MSNGISGLNYLLTFGSTAAFILPPPYGPLLSGGLQVFGMMSGNTSNFAQVIKDMVTELETYAGELVQEQTLSSAVDEMQTAAQTLFTQVNSLQQAGYNITTAGKLDIEPGSLLQAFLTNLQTTTTSSSSPLLTALNSLNTPEMLQGQGVFQTLTSGVGLFLTHGRLLVQMRTLQNPYDAQMTKDVLAYYDNFRQQTQQWCATIRGIIYGLKLARLKQVGPVVNVSSSIQKDFLEKRHAFSDPGPVPPPPYWTKGIHSQDSTGVSEIGYHESFHASEEDRDAYLTALASYIDSQYQPYIDGLTAANTTDADGNSIAGWLTQLSAWDEGLTPKPPVAAPAISTDAGSWAASTPQGTEWIRGATLQYAVAFANTHGISKRGPWSTAVTLGDLAYPTVTDLPVDPMDLATARIVYRQWGGQTIEEAAVIADNATTSFQDKGGSAVLAPSGASMPLPAGYWPDWVPPLPAAAPSVTVDSRPSGPLGPAQYSLQRRN